MYNHGAFRLFEFFAASKKSRHNSTIIRQFDSTKSSSDINSGKSFQIFLKKIFSFNLFRTFAKY